MSTPSGVPQAPVSAGGVEGQAAVIGEVAKEMYSLRFDGSSYLSKSRLGGSNTYTFSVWAKLSKLGKGQYFLSWDKGGLYTGLFIKNSSQIGSYNQPTLTYSAALFRDTSAWYHLVWSSNNGVSTVYINKESVLSFTSHTSSTSSAAIGRYLPDAQYNMSGYLANIHFIDGEALDPSAFGELISDVWRPASYSGDYGVNGFYLDFDPDNMVYDSNGKLTQVKDASGNDNHWTAN